MTSPSKRFYEAEAYRADGTCFALELLEASSDEEAETLAAHYPQKWQAASKALSSTRRQYEQRFIAQSVARRHRFHH